MKSNTCVLIAGIAVVAVAIVLLPSCKDDGRAQRRATRDATTGDQRQTADGTEEAQHKPTVPTIVDPQRQTGRRRRRSSNYRRRRPDPLQGQLRRQPTRSTSTATT